MSATVREFEQEQDSAPVAELLTRNSNSPVSAEEFEHNITVWPTGRPVKRRVVESEGRVIAYMRLGNYCDNPKNAFLLNLTVDEGDRNQGTGTSLFDEVLTYAKEFKASAIVSMVAETEDHSMAFVEKRSFKEAAKLFDVYLDLTKFKPEEHAMAVQRAEEQGYRVATLDEIELTDETKRTIAEAFSECDKDTPGIEYWGVTSWEEFDAWFFKSKSFVPQGVAVVMRGDEFVGFSNIERSTAAKPGDMFTGFTGVVPEHRGRGLAYAMKVKGIDYCIESGGKRLKAENDTRNKPMLAINRKLGFVESPGEIMYVRDLEAGE